MADWNGFKKNGTTYIPNDATARAKAAGAVQWVDAEKSVKKNLMPNKASSKTQNSATFTVNADKSVTVTVASGSSVSANTFLELGFFELEAGAYVLSQGVTTGNANCRLQLADGTGTVVAYIQSGEANHIGFTLNEKKTVQGVIRIPSGWNTASITFKSMLTKLGVPFDTYVPHIPDNTELMTWEANDVLGAKNILPNTAISGSLNNVTWVVNDDGTITINTGEGGASAHTYIQLMPSTYKLFPEGKYILSDDTDNPSLVYTFIDRKKGSSGTSNYDIDTNGHYNFNVDYSQYDYFRPCVRVNSGSQLTNYIVKPMVRPVSNTDNTYQPHAMTNRELTKREHSIESMPITDVMALNQGYSFLTGSCAYRVGNVMHIKAHILAETAFTPWVQTIIGYLKLKGAAKQIIVAQCFFGKSEYSINTAVGYFYNGLSTGNTEVRLQADGNDFITVLIETSYELA